MSAHDWVQQIPNAVLGLLTTILGAVIVRMLRRIHWVMIEAGLPPARKGGRSVQLSAWVKWKAKAIIGAAGLVVVGLVEYLIEQPDTVRVLEHVLPQPWAQLVPVALAGTDVWLLHKVPMGPAPGAALDAAPEPVADSAPVETVAPAAPAAAPVAPVAPASSASDPAAPPTSFIPLPQR